MAGDGKGRSVVTDFGAQPKKPSGKQASRDKRTDGPEAARVRAQQPPLRETTRARPSTTQIPQAPAQAPAAQASGAQARVPRTSTIKLPGAAVPAAHFAPGLDQSELHSRTVEKNRPTTTVQTTDEVLRGKDRRLHLLNEPDSEQSAAFRVLRHQVEAAGKPQVIAISSPEDGEGKTTAAANLALALAECGRASVLLVEANFRRPAMSRMFHLTPQAGFGDQLDRFHSAPGSPWHVLSLAACHLHILPLARGRAPAPLLDGPAFRYAIDGLRGADYDHIVIDCCSVLAGADVNLVQDSADAVLLVARARTTTARQMRAAVERLTPSHLLGTVLLGT